MSTDEQKDREADASPEQEAESSSEVAEEAAEGATDEVAPDSELAEALREKDQFRALLQRTQADFVNFRNRVESEREEIRQRAKTSLLTKVLDVVDSIDAALSEEATAGVDQKFVEGVAGVRRNFESFLSGEGVEKFESAGERFDPRRHEALVRTETSEHDPDTIINVMRAGYLIREEVLRPALVEVAAAVEEGEE